LETRSESQLTAASMIAQPLTQLSEEEALFFDTVLAYAKERIGPRARELDEKGALDAAMLPGLFELGVMGIEISGEHGGSASTFFNAILAVEALARVDASFAVLVDVQNTLVNNALLRWGSDATFPS
jgi:butyryl-CoA dehydrogenase/short/branched chain acyl-CoA dehydrogenase